MYPTFLKIFIYYINSTTSLFFYLNTSQLICIHLMGQNAHNRIYCFNTTDLCILKMVNYSHIVGQFPEVFSSCKTETL